MQCRWLIFCQAGRLVEYDDGGTQTRPRKIGPRWYQLVSGHTSMAGIRNDCEKRNEASIMGWLCLRVTKDMIEEGVALTQIKRALKSRENQDD